jgi:hypothetical protein
VREAGLDLFYDSIYTLNLFGVTTYRVDLKEHRVEDAWALIRGLKFFRHLGGKPPEDLFLVHADN